MLKEPACRCNCGYTCDRKCGLPMPECMEAHYRRDCDHQWDGKEIAIHHGASITCSKCGMSAINHDMEAGP